MTDRNKATDTNTPDATSDEEMRPLPDGGLAASMPDWLRRPPAWHNMQRAEEQGEQKDLPEPDTSEIDPRTLVDIDDLPTWLQEIAARSPATSTAGDQPETGPVAGTAPSSSTASPTGSAATSRPVASDSAPSDTAKATPPWIWAMRGAIILSILLVIFYVFFL